MAASIAAVVVAFLLPWWSRRRGRPRVAFLGNSICYYNDLPRLLATLHGGRLHQDSCMRGGADLPTLFARGNGISHLYGPLRAGAWSARRLLAKRWDFVVLQDQTQAPARAAPRAASAASLAADYAPLLRGATPVLLETYAYDAPHKGDVGGLDAFARDLEAGYAAYAAALAAAGAPAPRVAPCAAAFEIVRAERPALWRSLFQEDGYHPTPRGSLLLACVLYETIFEKPPALDDVAAPATLWSSARYFGGERDGAPAFPTADECRYLGDAARRAREKRKRC